MATADPHWGHQIPSPRKLELGFQAVKLQVPDLWGSVKPGLRQQATFGPRDWISELILLVHKEEEEWTPY